MVRYLLPLMVLLVSCGSVGFEMPSTEVRLLSPEDGSVVPDTFTLTFLAYEGGPTLRYEFVHGFPDGPVDRGRFPGCRKFEAVITVDGEEVGRYRGCDSLMATAKIRAKGNRVRITLKVGGTVKEATYTVLEPYPYTLEPLPPKDDTAFTEEPSVRHFRGVRVGETRLLLSWDGDGEVLYEWTDTLREVVRGSGLRVMGLGNVALVLVRREGRWFYGTFRPGLSPSLRPLEGELHPVDSVVCGGGGAYLTDVGVVWGDTSGESGLSGVSGTPYGARGCVEGLPYFAFLSDSVLLMIGRDTVLLPVPGGPPDVEAAFYGERGRVLLLKGNRTGIRTLLWDGSVWRKAHFPWEPIGVRCYPPVVGCLFLGFLPVPVAAGGDSCSLDLPFITPVSGGIGLYRSVLKSPWGVRFEGKTYRIRFKGGAEQVPYPPK